MIISFYVCYSTLKLHILLSRETTYTHTHTHTHTQIQEETNQWIKVIKIRQNKAENEQRNEK